MNENNRKIATILAADVVGYSRLMENDEEATLSALKQCRTVFDALVNDYGGLVFGSVGDSLMAQFPSAVNAVRCAQAIQKSMVEANRETRGDAQLQLRIGINLGDVIEEERSLYGDGVNIAARVQSLAAPGGILITGAVHEQTGNKVPARFRHDGQHYLKNIAHPVDIYELLEGVARKRPALLAIIRRCLTNHPLITLSAAMAAAVLVALLTWEIFTGKEIPGAITGRNIAVLPFENMSIDETGDWLGRGISEDILNLLAQIDELNVVARTSSFQDRLESMDVREIGRQLGARYILEGSVRSSGERVRIVAQLNDANTGYHVWSQEYNRRTTDVLSIQTEIANQVVKALKLALPGNFSMEEGARPTENVEAYDAYLQARALLERTTDVASLKNAEYFFRRALEFDPGFGLAYAGLCTSLVRQIEHQHDRSVLEPAEQACAGGMKLAPDAYRVHSALGELYVLKGDNEQALREYQWVVDNNADNIDARLGIAKIHMIAGNDDTADRTLHDAVLSSPGYSPTLELYGEFLIGRGRYREAQEIYQRLVDLEPKKMAAHNNLAAAYFLSGDFDQVAAIFRRAESMSLQPDGLAYTNLGSSHYYKHNFEDAEVMYRQAIGLLPEDYTVWGNLADCLRYLPGKEDQSRAAYEQARRLAEEALDINPDQGDVLAARAHYCAQLQDVPCATVSIDRALDLAGKDPYTHYSVAMASLYLGNEEQARYHLHLAEQLGFPNVLLDADPLLEPLHKGNVAEETVRDDN